ncbi:hypothetical protein SeMB42_g07050 [Synchytrium endobioticum]|uniref:PA14 domain-containing protein n=1 Tax=Synchytrium endobioticum TaxID=286115 RepID=A0A507CHB5_9FUNG|nr:hypothetical protein SeMB42_g07050 [Synchytrium endobioticum]TPX38942.1 hypothetical protein SeLEV6574_g07501 [Synchytrium endobioticum]
MLANTHNNQNLPHAEAPSVIASTALASTTHWGTINDLAQGLNFEYYRGEWDSLPDFPSLTPERTGVVNEISIDDKFEQEITDGTFSADGNFAVRYIGVIQIKDAGRYSFTLGSNDGAALFIAGKTVARNDGSHYYRESEGSIKLNSPGMYPLTVLYFHKSGKLLEGVMTGPQLNIRYGMIKEGIIFSSTESKQPISPSRLFHMPSKTPLTHNASLRSNGAVFEDSAVDNLQTALDEERAQSQILKRTLGNMLTTPASDDEATDMGLVDMVERVQQDVAKLRRDYFFSIGLAYKLGSRTASHIDLQSAWESLPEKMDHMHFGQFIRSQAESKTSPS